MKKSVQLTKSVDDGGVGGKETSVDLSDEVINERLHDIASRSSQLDADKKGLNLGLDYGYDE